MYDDFDELLARLKVPKAPNATILSYADGGPVEESSDEEDDDIPTISMEDARRLGATPVEEDDDDEDIPTISLEEARRLGAVPVDLQPESAVGTATRKAANAAIPIGAGLYSAAYGAGIGTAIAPGLGTLVGGVGGGIIGSLAAAKAQEVVKHAVGYDDEEQQRVNAEAHPVADWIGGVAPAAVALSPGGLEAALASRVLSGGVMAGINVGEKVATGQDINPTELVADFAVGAVFHKANRLGAKVMDPAHAAGQRHGEAVGDNVKSRFRPGRPDTQGDPYEGVAKAEAEESQQPITAGNSALVQSPPKDAHDTTGNPESAAVRSSREYPKDNAKPGPNARVQVRGDVSDEQRAALVQSAQGEEPPPVKTGIVEAAQSMAPRVETPETAPKAPWWLQPSRGGRRRVPVPREPNANETLPIKTGIVEAGKSPKGPSSTGLTEEKLAEHRQADRDAKAADTNPTPAQAAAGNYEKGHTKIDGLDVTIENPRGSIRRGTGMVTDEYGVEHTQNWEVQVPDHYGYVRRTEGADGDHVDAYIGRSGDKHFVVDQLGEDGKFDEHKLMLNYDSQQAAVDAYHRAFSDGKGPERLGAINELSPEELKDWLKNGDTTNPYSPTIGAKEIKPLPQVVSEALKRLREAEGGEAAAKRLEAAPEADQPQLARRALEALTNLSGKAPKGEYSEARVPSKAPTVEGTKVTARSAADAEKKAAALKAYQDAFEKFAPKDTTMPVKKPLKDRLEAAIAHADEALSKHDWSYKKKGETVQGKPYAPQDRTTSPGYMWLQAARQLINGRMTQKQIREFIATEQLLRSGDVENVAAGKRIQADIELSRRSGEQATDNAEAAQAKEFPGEIAPSEAAEPDAIPNEVKSAADLPPTEGRQLDVEKPEDRKAIADILLAGVDKPTSGEWKKAEAERLKADEEKTARLRAAREAKNGPSKLATADNIDDADVVTFRPKDLVEKFLGDEKAALNLKKLVGDMTASHNARAEEVLRNASKAQIKLRKGEPTTYSARLPKSPEEEYAQSVSNKLDAVRKGDQNHDLALLKIAKDAQKNPISQSEAIYHARDAEGVPSLRASEGLSTLPPNLRAAYDKYVKPLLDENDRLYNTIKALNPDFIGPKVDYHQYRIAIGSDVSNALHGISGFSEISGDPVAGRAIGTRAKGTGLERMFYAMERNSDGKRFVISPNKEGFTVWERGKRPQVIKDPSWVFEDGGTFDVGPHKFTMTQATTKEIAGNAPIRYYTNPMMSALMTNRELGSMARHLQMLEDLKPEIRAKKLGRSGYMDDEGVYHKALASKGEAAAGWRKTNLKNFDDWILDPHLANTFDDYAQPGFDAPGLDTLRKMSQAVTKTLFILPTAHLNNVGAHWFIGRGWDWINPVGYRRLVTTGMRAIDSVLRQDPLQARIRDNNGGLIAGGVLTRDMMTAIGKHLGQDIEKNPARYGAAIKALRLNTAGDLVKALYDHSSKAMWMGNDMFVTQAILENMEKGMTMQGAINSVHQHIPNYRIPTQVIGSGPKGRATSQILQEAFPTVFGRYHYAMINSYANIIKGIVKGTGEDRLKSVGQLMAVGALMMLYAYPMKKAAEKLTGNPDASFHMRGPATIPGALMEARKTGDLMAAVRPTMTVSPILSTIGETLGNSDFGGRKIVEPGDVQNMLKGSPSAAAKAATQEVEHGVRGLISPLNTAANSYNAGRGPLATVRDQVLDLKNPSPKARMWEAKAPVKLQHEAVTRYKKPHGPLEAAVNKVVGFK